MRKHVAKLIAILTAAFAVCLFAGCGGTTVDMNKYMTISVEGADGYGKAVAKFDKKGFVRDYRGKIKVNASPQLGLTSDDAAELLLDYCVNYRFDESENLANGDKITLKWRCDETTAKSTFDTKLKYSDIEYKVKDLEEVSVFDPFDYVTVSFDGYDTLGEVNVELDKSREEMQSLSVDKTAMKSGELSNGDKVEVTLKTSLSTGDWTAKYGNILSTTSKSYKVTGLTELKEINPFDNVTVTYTGIAPFAKANIDSNGEQNFSFNVAEGNTSNLKNGDTFTLAVNSGNYAAKGFKLTETEKVYTAADIPEYITGADQITDEALGKMQEQAESVIKSYAATWADAEGLKSFDYLGLYLLTRKVPDSYKSNNYIYLVYVLHAENDADGAVDDYFYVSYENAVYCPEDDSCQVDVNNYKRPEGSSFFGSIYGEAFLAESGRYYYQGYKDLNSMESALITQNLADFRSEATGELAK